MSAEHPSDLQQLLVRMAQGDSAARAEAIHCAYERLRRLARVILNEDFPRLKAAPSLLQTTDVANEAAVGMYSMLASIEPATAADFFRLAAQRIRWLLLDRAKLADRTRRQSLLELADTSSKSQEPPDSPRVNLEILYQQIEELPENEREAVDLLYFHGLLHREAAEVLGVTERSIRRYWASARLKLFHNLKHLLPAEPESTDVRPPR